MQSVLRQYGPVKTSSDRFYPEYAYSRQLHSEIFEGLRKPDLIEISLYLQGILAYE